MHPYCGRQGEVKALETIRFALTTHRGCYGECNFCAIAVHQGRTVTWRSRKSIVAEAQRLAAHPRFKGIIQDVGGPTANMYGFECAKKLEQGGCPKKRCLFPRVCPHLPVDHGPQIKLLQELRRIKGVRKVVVASGIRYDMILADRQNGLNYLRELVRHHVSGQMKIAPEHSEESCSRPNGQAGHGQPAPLQGAVHDLNRRGRTPAVSDLLSDRRLSRLHPGGYAASPPVLSGQSEAFAPAGPDLYPHPLDLRHPHVLDRAGPVERRALFCGKDHRRPRPAERGPGIRGTERRHPSA